MWAFLVKHKGCKFAFSLADPLRPRSAEDQSMGLLWHNVDKYPDELALSRKANFAKNLLVESLKTIYVDIDATILEKCVDANKDPGSVVVIRKNLPGVENKSPIQII